MTRLSFLRLAGFFVVAGASFIGCVEDDPVGGSTIPICPRYCDEMDARCSGLEYKDRNQCLAACGFMKPGNEGDKDDSAGCRLGNAKLATTGDKASCKKASAYGGEACGDPCTTFCKLVNEICIKGGDGGTPPYTSESSCFEECKTITYDKAGDEGPQAFEGGDTLNCRMFHLLLAIDDRIGHCPHTGKVSATCKTRP
jgi:hypothetical protein